MTYSSSGKTKTGNGCSLSIVGWILLIAGIFFLSVAILKDAKLAVFGLKTDGVVTRNGPQQKSSNHLYSVQFTPDKSDTLTFETTATFGVDLKEGDKVQVIYLKSNPNKAEIYSAKQLWMPLIVGFTVSSVCLVLGIYFIAVGRMTKLYSIPNQEKS